jgi:hypothetical protein
VDLADVAAERYRAAELALQAKVGQLDCAAQVDGLAGVGADQP